jgi:hypothetical protein
MQFFVEYEIMEYNFGEYSPKYICIGSSFMKL